MNGPASQVVRRRETGLVQLLIDGALLGSSALPTIASGDQGPAATLYRLSLWAKGYEPSGDGKGQHRRTVPRFTKGEKAAGRADRLVHELARQGSAEGATGACGETRERRWSFVFFEREKTVVILDKKQHPKTRESNGEAAAERQWIAEGRTVWHVPAVECDTPDRLRFVARYLAIVLGRAVLPWEEAAAERERRQREEEAAAEREREREERHGRDHSLCPWPPDSHCNYHHLCSPRWHRRHRPAFIERDRRREIEWEEYLEARRTPEEREEMARVRMAFDEQYRAAAAERERRQRDLAEYQEARARREAGLVPFEMRARAWLRLQFDCADAVTDEAAFALLDAMAKRVEMDPRSGLYGVVRYLADEADEVLLRRAEYAHSLFCALGPPPSRWDPDLPPFATLLQQERDDDAKREAERERFAAARKALEDATSGPEYEKRLREKLEKDRADSEARASAPFDGQSFSHREWYSIASAIDQADDAIAKGAIRAFEEAHGAAALAYLHAWMQRRADRQSMHEPGDWPAAEAAIRLCLRRKGDVAGALGMAAEAEEHYRRSRAPVVSVDEQRAFVPEPRYAMRLKEDVDGRTFYRRTGEWLLDVEAARRVAERRALWAASGKADATSGKGRAKSGPRLPSVPVEPVRVDAARVRVDHEDPEDDADAADMSSPAAALSPAAIP